MNTIRKLKHDLDPDLYVRQLPKWKAERAAGESIRAPEKQCASFTGTAVCLCAWALVLAAVLVVVGVV